MELVEGGETLLEQLEGGPLWNRESASDGRQIADALEAAHEKGIIHRDLKPANIKVTPDGESRCSTSVWRSDKRARQERACRQLAAPATPRARMLGTPAYMSPEQARGEAWTTHGHLGVRLRAVRIAHGHGPFGGATLSDTIAAVLEHEPDWRLCRPDAERPRSDSPLSAEGCPRPCATSATRELSSTSAPRLQVLMRRRQIEGFVRA